MEFTIERSDINDLGVLNFIHKEKKTFDNAMRPPVGDLRELFYRDLNKTYDTLKTAIELFNDDQDKKAKRLSKKKTHYAKRAVKKLIIGRGSSHIWIHLDGEMGIKNRVAIINEL